MIGAAARIREERVILGDMIKECNVATVERDTSQRQTAETVNEKSRW
jgi:hypothetical protein